MSPENQQIPNMFTSALVTKVFVGIFSVGILIGGALYILNHHSSSRDGNLSNNDLPSNADSNIGYKLEDTSSNDTELVKHILEMRGFLNDNGRVSSGNYHTSSYQNVLFIDGKLEKSCIYSHDDSGAIVSGWQCKLPRAFADHVAWVRERYTGMGDNYSSEVVYDGKVVAKGEFIRDLYLYKDHIVYTEISNRQLSEESGDKSPSVYYDGKYLGKLNWDRGFEVYGDNIAFPNDVMNLNINGKDLINAGGGITTGFGDLLLNNKGVLFKGVSQLNGQDSPIYKIFLNNTIRFWSKAQGYNDRVAISLNGHIVTDASIAKLRRDNALKEYQASITSRDPDGDVILEGLYEESIKPTNLETAMYFSGAVYIQQRPSVQPLVNLYCNRVSFESATEYDFSFSSTINGTDFMIYNDGKLIDTGIPDDFGKAHNNIIALDSNYTNLVYAIYFGDKDETIIYKNQLPYKNIKGDKVEFLGVRGSHVIWIENGRLYYDNNDLGEASEYEKGYVAYEDHILFIQKGDDGFYFDGKQYFDYSGQGDGRTSLGGTLEDVNSLPYNMMAAERYYLENQACLSMDNQENPLINITLPSFTPKESRTNNSGGGSAGIR